MDPNFIKLFRLSQLIIEYLLVRSLPFLPLSFITLPPFSSVSLSLHLSPPLFSFTQHSQQYLSEQGHALQQWLQQSQQVMESVYVPISLVSCNNLLRIVSPSPRCWSHCNCSLSARLEELKTVKKENRKRRKVIEAYQEMMSAGATGLHAVSC